MKTSVLILSLLIVHSFANAQELPLQYTYSVDKVLLYAEHSQISEIDLANSKSYKDLLALRGSQGYEVVYVYTSQHMNNSCPGRPYCAYVYVTFKKANNPGAEFYSLQAKKIDSIANTYVQKEIAKAKTDLIGLVNNNTKSIVTKELIDEITAVYNANLKISLEKLKQEIISELKK